MTKKHVGGKKLLKGDEKRGDNAYCFPQLVRSMHMFSPIDLKFTKLQKKLNVFLFLMLIKYFLSFQNRRSKIVETSITLFFFSKNLISP